MEPLSLLSGPSKYAVRATALAEDRKSAFVDIDAQGIEWLSHSRRGPARCSRTAVKTENFHLAAICPPVEPLRRPWQIQ